MSSDESLSSSEFQDCILKCPDAEKFYDFPAKTVLRNVWYYKLGLDDEDFHPYSTVCDRHFSKKMFNLDGSLKAIAVPDRNLPENNELLLEKSSIDEETIEVPPIQTNIRRSFKKKTVKSVEFPSLESTTAPLNSNPPELDLDTNSQTNAINPLSTQSWVNDNPEILVDYQLRVGGKHLCDVIEIPQYIVVFTVIKAKQNNTIKLSDIKANSVKNKKKVKPTSKRPALKNLPKPSAFITIDDEINNDQEISSQSVTKAAVQTKSLEIEPTNPKSLPFVEEQPDYADLQAELLEILGPELPNVTVPKNSPIIKSTIPIPKPEIDVVFFTTDDVPPRRDREVQVDFSRKRQETGIQCDVLLDQDIKEMSKKSLRSASEVNNAPEDIEECHICGEILSTYASKVEHARAHEASPSLCSQCGYIFDSQIELGIHEQTYHLYSWNSGKPQRCPRTNCNKAFRSLKQLNNHIEEHVRTRQHKCNKCLEFFSSAMKLVCHQRALDKCLRTRGWTSRRWSKRI